MGKRKIERLKDKENMKERVREGERENKYRVVGIVVFKMAQP